MWFYIQSATHNFPFSLLPLFFSYLNNVKCIGNVLWLFSIFHVFFRKRINISVTLVSESYVLLYYETKVYMLFINKICLNQTWLLMKHYKICAFWVNHNLIWESSQGPMIISKILSLIKTRNFHPKFNFINL